MKQEKLETKLNNMKVEILATMKDYQTLCDELGVIPDPVLLEVRFCTNIRSIRAAILQSVSTKDPTTVTDIFTRVRQYGVESHEVSIRNEISKLKGQGALVPVGHGSYLRNVSTPEVMASKKEEAVQNAG